MKEERDDTTNLAGREYSIPQPGWRSANPRDGNKGGLGKAAVDGGLTRTLSQRLATTEGDDGS